MNANINSNTRLITLWRDELLPLQFIGHDIRAASRTRNFSSEPDDFTYVISARLYQTVRDEYVIGVDVFCQDDGRLICRDGERSVTLDALVEALYRRSLSSKAFSWLNDDILAELFDGTDIGPLFIEPVD